MTKKKFLYVVAMLILLFTLNITKTFAWFTASNSIELSATSGTWIRPYLVSGEEFNSWSYVKKKYKLNVTNFLYA